MSESKGRGRPRPVSAIERDEAVFLLLSGDPKNLHEMAEYLGVNDNMLYLSLTRLRTAGRVMKVRAGKRHLWTHTNNQG